MLSIETANTQLMVKNFKIVILHDKIFIRYTFNQSQTTFINSVNV